MGKNYKIALISISLFISVTNTCCQTIVGEVRDENGVGIINVLIQDPDNTFKYTKTIKRGLYSTSVLKENQKVEIRANGYQTKEVILKDKQVHVLTKLASNPLYIYHNDVDFVRAGLYTKDECKPDFSTVWANGFLEPGNNVENTDRVFIDPDQNVGGKSIRIWYPKGKVDSKESGAQWQIDLKGEYDELYLSYWVRFSPDFDFTLGGKLPGFDGSEGGYTSNINTWSGKIMWRENGQAEFYLHPPGTRTKERFWWDYKGTIAKFKKGVWQKIQIHYKLNDVGKKNGILEAWLDDVLVGQVLNTDVFRATGEEKVRINNLFFSTFYGGDITYAPTKEEYAWFDHFTVFNQFISTNNVLTEIENFKNEDRVSDNYVYPNPSTDGIFHLENANSWEIFTAQGLHILHGNTSEINLTAYQKGIYLLKINNKSVKKIVIN